MKKYSLNEVLDKVIVPIKDKEHPNKMKVDFDGDLMKLSSQRLILFKSKGVRCVKCGIKGDYFIKEYNTNPNPHFNLYGTDENGNPRLITKDHIIPKSKGGANLISNYQTMCKKCNEEKGNKIYEII